MSEDSTKIVKIDTLAKFESAVDERRARYAALLPGHVDKEQFRTSLVEAVRSNPDLLRCTPHSLFGACTKAAEDGLLPNGREGAIVIHSAKERSPGSDRQIWVQKATWMPMVAGIRKRAWEVGRLLIEAEISYANDTRRAEFGDHPSFSSIPPGCDPLADRGDAVGAYAIVRHFPENGGEPWIVHREFMTRQQIEAVKAKSRNPEGLLWKEFWEEAWRKTVVRRAMKSVPLSHGRLDMLVAREDEHFEFDAVDVESVSRKSRPRRAPIAPPAAPQSKPEPTVEVPEPPAIPEFLDRNHTELDVPAGEGENGAASDIEGSAAEWRPTDPPN